MEKSFEEIAEKINKNIETSKRAGCTSQGIVENALAYAINLLDGEGGWSVDFLDEHEIFFSQHHEAGGKQFSIYL